MNETITVALASRSIRNARAREIWRTWNGMFFECTFVRLEAPMTLRHVGGFLFGRQPSLGRELIDKSRQMLAQA